MQKLNMTELKEVLQNELANGYCKSDYVVGWEDDPYDCIQIYYLYLGNGIDESEDKIVIQAVNDYNDETCLFPNIEEFLECLTIQGQPYAYIE